MPPRLAISVRIFCLIFLLISKTKNKKKEEEEERKKEIKHLTRVDWPSEKFCKYFENYILAIIGSNAY